MRTEVRASNVSDETFQVGCTVSFNFGQKRLKGLIVEDRGAIGVGGRHLFRIEVPFESEDTMIFELPASELQVA